MTAQLDLFTLEGDGPGLPAPPPAVETPQDQDGGVAPPSPAWLGFTPDHDADDARACYFQRYGAQPTQVVRCPGVLLVGPLLGQAAGR